MATAILFPRDGDAETVMRRKLNGFTASSRIAIFISHSAIYLVSHSPLYRAINPAQYYFSTLYSHEPDKITHCIPYSIGCEGSHCS
jgi:hypothetical protein